MAKHTKLSYKNQDFIEKTYELFNFLKLREN